MLNLPDVECACECTKQLVLSIDAVKAAIYSLGGSMWLMVIFHGACTAK